MPPKNGWRNDQKKLHKIILTNEDILKKKKLFLPDHIANKTHFSSVASNKYQEK